MSDQEMQFADPDWKPTSSLEQGKQGRQNQAPYTPRPINDAWREPPQAPYVEAPDETLDQGDLPPYTGYAGSMPAQEQPYQYQSQQKPYYRRRRRSPWLWIILLILLFALFGGGFSSLGSLGQKDALLSRNYTISSGTPTIVINDPSGDIHVQQGATNAVNIQADRRAGLFDDPNNIQVKFIKDGNTIDVTVGTGYGFLSDRSVEFTVTVPQNVNLQLQTSSGDISVDNIQGQANLSATSGDITANNDVFSPSSSLQAISGDVNTRLDTFSDSTAISTSSGDINLDHDALQGHEKFNTTSGDINFVGSVAANGIYQFNTTSGDIDIALLQNPSFTVDAQTTSGNINADDYPGIQVQQNNFGSGSTATGSVGSSPYAQLILRATSGDITLHQS
jgi:hypothetical protein